MHQILSFPWHEKAPLHEAGLSYAATVTGKSYEVASGIYGFDDAAAYLDGLETAMGQGEKPQLIICDFDRLNTFKALLAEGRFDFLRSTPMVVVSHAPHPQSLPLDIQKSFNVVGTLPPYAQWKPAEFVRLVEAFDAAQHGGGVTTASFQAAIGRLGGGTYMRRPAAVSVRPGTRSFRPGGHSRHYE